MTIERNYQTGIDPRECLRTVQQEGAVLLRDFVLPEEQGVLEREVLAHDLTEVDRSGHTIAEQFEDIGWEFSQAPPAVRVLGERVCQLVHPSIPEWNMNQVRAQLYKPGEAGIDWHRDYKRDLRVVAVVSLMRAAHFYIRLNRGEVSWQLLPGDLVLMRGALLNGRRDDRPQHRVFAPESGRRLSIAYRHVVDEVPELEESDEH